jgi:hypothetical protein
MRSVRSLYGEESESITVCYNPYEDDSSQEFPPPLLSSYDPQEYGWKYAGEPEVSFIFSSNNQLAIF